MTGSVPFLRRAKTPGSSGSSLMSTLGLEGVELLFLLDELLVEVRRWPEGQVEERVERRKVLLLLREGRSVETDDDPRKSVGRPGNVGVHRTLRGRLLRDGDGVRALLPPAPVLLDEREDRLGLHVPGDDDRRVLGTVPAVEEGLRVRVLVGHVLDVLEEAHRRVLVRVDLEGLVARDLVDLLDRVRAVLVVLAENGARLGLERRLVVREVLEPVGLDLQHRLEVFLRERRVVVRVVVRRVGVLLGARARHDRLVLLRRVLLRPAKHHVLEEVGEAGLAGLDLVPRARLHGDLERDDVRKSRGHDDHLQPVRKSRLRGLERQEIGFRLLGARAGGHEGEEDSGKGAGTTHAGNSF